MKTRNIILSAIASAVLCSCNGFLTELPTSLTADYVYRSQEAVEAGVFGIYEKLEKAVGGTAFSYYLQNGSRFQDWTGDRTSMSWEQSIYMTMFSSTSDNQSLYSSLYEGVNRCNSVLEGVQNSQSVSEDFKIPILAEVRFLRAEFYFILARLYGDLPLILSTPRNVEDVCVPRSSYMKVYKQILDDLDYANKNMRTKEEQEKINPGKGRFYRMAANAVMAKVYIQIACYLESPDDQFFDISKPGRYPDFSECGLPDAESAWRAALEAAESVINDPLHTYDLEPDYRNLFRWDPLEHPEDYMSKERIMALQTSAVAGTHQRASYRLWKNPKGTRETTGNNSNAGRARPNKIVWEMWGRLYDGKEGSIDGYESKCIKTPPDDPRINVTYAYNKVDRFVDGQEASERCFPSRAGEAKRDAYWMKNFSKAYKADAGTADYYLLRMADVYFDAAEAAASLGDANKAVDYINVIHRRARQSVDDPQGNPAPEPRNLSASEFGSKEALINRIFWEREFEEHGEDHEWFVTHRRGARWLITNILEPWNEFMCKDINLGEDKNTNSMWAPFNCTKDNPPTTDFATVRAALICAFPNYELRYNTALGASAQNDFYIK